VNQRLLEDVAAVEDAAIVEAMAFCFARLKVVVEPSGATALAALLSGAVTPRPRTAVVLSGGNITPADFAALLERHPKPSPTPTKPPQTAPPPPGRQA
jgi:threo-3-hydroxy-L-aspartate ammonia-lyase